MRLEQIAGIAALGLACAVPAVAGVKIKSVDLDAGHVEDNAIPDPVLDSSGIAQLMIGNIRSAYDRDDYIFHALKEYVLDDPEQYKKARWTVDPSVDCGALLTTALHTEARTVGLPLTEGPGDSHGWRLDGVLLDIEFEATTGWVFHYFAYMDVELTVRRGEEQPTTFRLHLHNLYLSYKDKGAARVLPRFIVESAREILARLNRDVFHAPPSDAVSRQVARLQALDGDELEKVLMGVKLSGSQEAAEILIPMFQQSDSDSDQQFIADALANLGYSQAVPVLIDGYDERDEDVRFFTLKALDYIGGPEAVDFLKKTGAQDDALQCRRLATR